MRQLLGVLLTVAMVLLVGQHEAVAAACKTDGTDCRTSTSCCGTNGHNGLCVNSAPPGKRASGVCCTPTTCEAAGAECGTIVNGTCLTLEPLACGTCPAGETCGAGAPNVCGTTTTTTSTTTSSSSSTTVAGLVCNYTCVNAYGGFGGATDPSWTTLEQCQSGCAPICSGNCELYGNPCEQVVCSQCVGSGEACRSNIDCCECSLQHCNCTRYPPTSELGVCEYF